MNPTTAPADRRTRTRSALPWMWLGLSVAWVLLIVVTGQPAWPLAVWIATTVVPLTAITARPESRNP